MTTGLPTGPLRARGDLPSLLCCDPYGDPGRSDLEFMGLGDLEAETPISEMAGPLEIIDAMLGDRSAAFAARAYAHCRRHGVDEVHYPSLLIDDVTRAMLEAMDTSPAAIAMLTRPVDEITLLAEEEGVEIVAGIAHVEAHEDPTCDHHACLSVRIPLGDGVVWTPGWLEIPALPDTIALIVPGMRLADVVSHPMLDVHPLLIGDWDGQALSIDMKGMTSSVWSIKAPAEKTHRRALRTDADAA